ncbi:MAG TPA: sigma-54 dependent transcriptional regulator [Terriglobia bacterium]|nr:sigma-54 dependent transcriptional regulator [Terriglobia bacterium]
MEPPPPIIAMVEDEHQASLREFIEEGSFDTISTPPSVVELRHLLRRAAKSRQAQKELEELRAQERSGEQLDGLIGCSQSMQSVFAMARRIAPCDVTVLITGETGTGKSQLARVIHRLSPRSSNRLVSFSCANLPETLIEEELFGHEKGAFTGAVATRRGRLEAADHGSLFLDEIGDLPLGLQSKFLHVLQERSFERLGSNIPLPVNIRVICATHRNLESMVQQGHFRQDLYYRLNVVQLHIPPLRERQDAIPALAQHFLQFFAKQFGRETTRFSNSAMQALMEYSWPGNVRELENAVQRAVVMAEGPSIEVWHLPKTMIKDFDEPRPAQSYEEQLREFKRRLIVRALKDCGGNKAEAARVLKIARGYLHRLIHELHILPEETTSALKPQEALAPQFRLM